MTSVSRNPQYDALPVMTSVSRNPQYDQYDALPVKYDQYDALPVTPKPKGEEYLKSIKRGKSGQQVASAYLKKAGGVAKAYAERIRAKQEKAALQHFALKNNTALIDIVNDKISFKTNLDIYDKDGNWVRTEILNHRFNRRIKQQGSSTRSRCKQRE
jgi:hypothetical protein